mgnify:CR=1 FL=1
MSESNKMKEMPVNRLMVQMGIPMIVLSTMKTSISEKTLKSM